MVSEPARKISKTYHRNGLYVVKILGVYTKVVFWSERNQGIHKKHTTINYGSTMKTFMQVVVNIYTTT